MAKLVSEKAGKYMKRDVRERVYSLGNDYKGALFSEDTHTVQEILFEDGNEEMAQIIRATGTRQRNGGKEEYITMAMVNKKSEEVDLELELDLKPAP
jgi:hypothetical protein